MAPDYKKANELPTNPKQNAGFWSLVTFSWLTGLMTVGKNRPLESEDMFPLLTEDQSEELTERLEAKWKETKTEENCKAKSRKGMRLLRALWGITPVSEYCLIATLLTLDNISRLTQPLLLIELLALLMKDSPKAAYNPRAYYYACGISITAFIMAVSKCHLDYRSSMVGMRIRAGLLGFMYKRVSKPSRVRFTLTYHA